MGGSVHGWLEVRELRGGSMRKGASIRMRPKPAWAVVVDGMICFLRGPGRVKEAYLMIDLDLATVHRLSSDNHATQLSVAIDYLANNDPSGAKSGLVLTFRSPWAYKTWTDVMLRNAGPFPENQPEGLNGLNGVYGNH